MSLVPENKEGESITPACYSSERSGRSVEETEEIKEGSATEGKTGE